MALAIGLLIGAERERHKLEKAGEAAAGIRTFAVTALAGAVSLMAGGATLLAVTTGGVALIGAVSYWRLRDQEGPGVTTEIALVLTMLIGALAMMYPAVAAGCGAVVALLLASRAPLHDFVGRVLTQDELRDGLILAVATLAVLPLLPDEGMGPFNALNPRTIFLIAILVMAIGAAGHVGVRILGTAYGLPLAGLAGGFVSSVATIGAMGGRTRRAPAALRGAVAGAVLSTVATVAQMAAVLAVISPAALRAMTWPLVLAGVAAAVYGALFTLSALRGEPEETDRPGRAFSIRSALLFAGLLAAIMLAAAALREWFGAAGVLVAAAAGGFADTHAAAVSVASLGMEGAEAAVPILAAFTTNSVSKLAAAWTGGRAFAVRVIPGIVAVAAAGWAGLFLPAL